MYLFPHFMMHDLIEHEEARAALKNHALDTLWSS